MQFVTVTRKNCNLFHWKVGEIDFAITDVLTAPVPQSLVLHELVVVDLSSPTKFRIQSIDYECCLAVIAALVKPS